MEVGSVYRHANFKFDDGGVDDKLLVVLSKGDASAGKNFIVCVTTSKPYPPERKIHESPGCQGGGEVQFQEHYYFFKAKQDLFEFDTWVQFRQVWEFEAEGLLTDSMGTPAVKIGDLSQEGTRAVLNCVLESLDIYARLAKQIRGERDTLRDNLKRSPSKK